MNHSEVPPRQDLFKFIPILVVAAGVVGSAYVGSWRLDAQAGELENVSDAVVANQDAIDKMLGVLFTGWSVRPDGLLTALRSDPKPFKLSAKPSRDETTRGVAATIRAGLKELGSPAE